MSKFYGRVGYITTYERTPGIWDQHISDRFYPMEIYRNSKSIQTGAKINDDITVSMIVSFVADPFAYENFHSIQYVEYLNSKWKVNSVEVEYPRLKLTLGGLYHEADET